LDRINGVIGHDSDDRYRFTINSIFEEVVAPERLVWRTIKDPNRNPAPPTSVNTITLEERGLQTK
jgi:hypothetical protein